MFLLDNRYDFLKTDKDIAGQVILLMVGGAHSYGIATEESDIDLRGITIESPHELFGIKTVGTFVDPTTDTVLYRLKQAVNLLLKNNPNILEILGCDDESIIEISPEGKLLRDNLPLFLNKNSVKAFGGYASDQLRRARNGLHLSGNRNQDILGSLCKLTYRLQENYNLSVNFHMDSLNEIYIKVNPTNIPLKAFLGASSEINNTMSGYGNPNHRNNKKSEKGIFKHLSHLVRILVTGIELLESGNVSILRKTERDILLGIKQGKYTLDEIFLMVENLEEKFRYAKLNHCLPDVPDYEKINALLEEIYTTRGHSIKSNGQTLQGGI